jgi:hypothetical protein
MQAQIQIVCPLTRDVVNKFFVLQDNMVYSSGVLVRGGGRP